jgi:NADH:ubiquinone oxidoreductase subunit E
MSSFVFNRASQMPDVVRTDPRVKSVITAMNKFGRRPDSLIQILHAAQGMYGYLPLPIIRFIAQVEGAAFPCFRRGDFTFLLPQAQGRA